MFQIVATWQGDFRTTSFFPSFSSKFLLIPDPLIVQTPGNLRAGEEAEFRKKALLKEEYTVMEEYITNSMVIIFYYGVLSIGWRKVLDGNR